MPIFIYKAKDLSGNEFTNTLDAKDLQSAALTIQAKGYFPISIKILEDKNLNKNIFKINKINQSDVSMFTRRLADALIAGISVSRALAILAKQTENIELKSITQDIYNLVIEGTPLSSAMNKYPKIFPQIYIGMIKAGEATGTLETVLTRLAEFTEKEKELKSKITSALIYPIILLFLGMASVVFLLTFVIPKFEIMFTDIQQSIPLPTQILIFSSHLLKNYFWIYIPLIIISSLFILKFSKTEKGLVLISRIKLKIPLFGNFLEKNLTSRFLRMLSIMLSNGVPILDSLIMAKNAINNKTLAQEIDKIYESVKQGKGLLAPIKKISFFPPMIADIIAIGEETGEIESSILRIAESYEREVDLALKTTTSLIEPIMILIIGAIICFIALAMLLPIYQMSMGA
jgi:general secretion pathway protein F